MSVQGGGGKKVPPGNTPVVRPRASGAGPAKSDKAPEKAPEVPADKPSARDAFSSDRARASMLHDGHASTTSGINIMVKVLEQSRANLAVEHKALAEQAAHAVELLLASGFSEATLERTRGELHSIRTRMRALRRRLMQVQRRLKLASANAGKIGDLNLAKLLASQLKQLQQLEPGMSRSLQVLHVVEQLSSEGGAGVSRTHVDHAPAPTGDALARLAPSASVSRAAAALLRGVHDVHPSNTPSLPAGDDATVRSLHELADALLGGAVRR